MQKKIIIFSLILVVAGVGIYYKTRKPPFYKEGTYTIENFKFEDMVVGTGHEAMFGKEAIIRFKGFLTNGEKIDSNWDREIPPVRLGNGLLLPGIERGVLGMKEGGKRRLFMPADMAFGSKGSGSYSIPPNSSVIYEIELIQIKN